MADKVAKKMHQLLYWMIYFKYEYINILNITKTEKLKFLNDISNFEIQADKFFI